MSPKFGNFHKTVECYDPSGLIKSLEQLQMHYKSSKGWFLKIAIEAPKAGFSVSPFIYNHVIQVGKVGLSICWENLPKISKYVLCENHSSSACNIFMHVE